MMGHTTYEAPKNNNACIHTYKQKQLRVQVHVQRKSSPGRSRSNPPPILLISREVQSRGFECERKKEEWGQMRVYMLEGQGKWN